MTEIDWRFTIDLGTLLIAFIGAIVVLGIKFNDIEWIKRELTEIKEEINKLWEAVNKKHGHN